MRQQGGLTAAVGVRFNSEKPALLSGGRGDWVGVRRARAVAEHERGKKQERG